MGGLKVATRESVTALARALVHDEWRVRDAAASALGNMGKAAAETVPLLRRLAVSKDSFAAVTALGRIWTKEATDALWAVYEAARGDLKDEAHDQLTKPDLLPKREEH